MWICDGCTTAYSVGAPACPHCGSTAYTEEHMAKITVHGGASTEPDNDKETSMTEPEATAEEAAAEESAPEEAAAEEAPGPEAAEEAAAED